MKFYAANHQDLWDIKRFQDDTGYMAEFIRFYHPDDTPCEPPYGSTRQFLTEAEYRELLRLEECGEIRIVRLSKVIEGHIVFRPLFQKSDICSLKTA